jgi:hypothetical protein
MDPMAYTSTETLAHLPKLLDDLRNAPIHAIGNLTRTRVKEAVSGHQGVYLFSEKSTGKPAYVGRSANLPQRLGTNHRSKLRNQAPVTKAIMDNRKLTSMAEARNRLYEEYVVRILAESDVCTRAMLEVYAAMTLNTKMNSFLEH